MTAMPREKRKTHDGLFEYYPHSPFLIMCGAHKGIHIRYIDFRKKYNAEVKCEIFKERVDGQFRTMKKCLVCTNEDYDKIKEDIEKALKIVAKWEIKTHKTGRIIRSINNYGIAEKVLEK